MSYQPRPSLESALWLLAVLVYGVGDVATTVYFISTTAATEGHPVVAAAIDAVGIWISVPWKVAAIALFYAAYRLVPKPHALGIPIGLVLLGAGLTTWNLYVGMHLL